MTKLAELIKDTESMTPEEKKQWMKILQNYQDPLNRRHLWKLRDILQYEEDEISKAYTDYNLQIWSYKESERINTQNLHRWLLVGMN